MSSLRPYKAFIDTNLMENELIRISEERLELKKRQQVLRTRQCRLNKILIDLKQVELPFDEK